MTGTPLGRLTRVDLREIWTSEATEFTPWFARPENLAVLGETLDIDPELIDFIGVSKGIRIPL